MPAPGYEGSRAKFYRESHVAFAGGVLGTSTVPGAWMLRGWSAQVGPGMGVSSWPVPNLADLWCHLGVGGARAGQSSTLLNSIVRLWKWHTHTVTKSDWSCRCYNDTFKILGVICGIVWLLTMSSSGSKWGVLQGSYIFQSSLPGQTGIPAANTGL